MSSRNIKRELRTAVLVSLAFVGSCILLTPASLVFTDPLTHTRVDQGVRIPFPILVMHEDEPQVLMVEDLHQIPALAAGTTYLVPEGKERDIEQYLNVHQPPAGDSGWVLKVERLAPDRQRIEVFLMGDGYFGGAYDATPHGVTPRYRKLTGPGFALIAIGVALAMNASLWGVGALVVAAIRRWRRARAH